MDLLNQLTQNLGVTEEQARGGTGLIMKMARDQLPTNDYNQIVNNIPGVDNFIRSAPEITTTEKAIGGISSATGVGGGIQNFAGLTNGFSKLGLDSGMVTRFVPIVLSFVQTKCGDNTRTVLEKILK